MVKIHSSVLNKQLTIKKYVDTVINFNHNRVVNLCSLCKTFFIVSPHSRV